MNGFCACPVLARQFPEPGIICSLISFAPMNRPLLAFLIAPLTSAIVLALLQREPLMALIWAPMAYMFSLPAIPVYFLFRWRGWLRAWQVTGSATLLGVLVAFIIFSGVPSLMDVQSLAIAGAFTGAVFWFVLTWRAGAKPAADR